MTGVQTCALPIFRKVEIAFDFESDGVAITATLKTSDRTGIEMEALTAVSVAGLTLIDMVKAMDLRASLVNVQVESKSGGKNGSWKR